jgi:hypothetical protein
VASRREQKERKHRDWESWIDEQIRRAQDEGQFDDLAGKGRPLDLTANPLAGDREMAFKILKDAGYAPEWIELDKAIRARLERARRALFRAWEWYQDSGGASDNTPAPPAPFRPQPDRSPATEGQHLVAWRAAVDAFQREVAAINAQIAALNLKVPSPRFQRFKVDAEREVRSLVGGAS